MLYFYYRKGQGLVEIAEDFLSEPDDTITCISRHEIGCFDIAEQIAKDATKLSGDLYLVSDAGDHVHPRFDVFKAPQVGDAVSKEFNGDAYSCGKIVSIGNGPTMLIKTDTNQTFKRRNSRAGSWAAGSVTSPFSMVPGHVEKRNMDR